MKLIDKDALVAEIERRLKANGAFDEMGDAAWWEDKGMCDAYKSILSFVDTLEVIDPYITCIQYTNREAAIKAHAEDYSWNIESELFQQLTPEQQKLWRKEIEQACISGGYSGLNLAKDPRYKENLEVKEVEEESVSEDFEEEMDRYIEKNFYGSADDGFFSNRTKRELEVEDVVRIGCHFAAWQKEQDKETIELAKNHAMLAGMEKICGQMIKDAIPANILTNQYGNKYIQSWSGLKQYDKYKNGDEVKIIIIKKE